MINFKRYLRCGLILFLIAAAFPAAPVLGQEAAPTPPYILEREGAYQRFTNGVDGYSLLVDQNLIMDTSRAEAGVRLESADQRLDLWTQRLNNLSAGEYIGYSNGFLKNSVDHYGAYQGDYLVNGYKVHVTGWTRDKLLRVQGDKNFYVCLDIPYESRQMLTILLSSTKPIALADCFQLLKEFRAEAKIAPQYLQRLAPASLSLPQPAWNEETRNFFDKYFSPNSKLTWGIFEPAAPYNFNELNNFENQINYTFPILLNYTHFDNPRRHPDVADRLANAYRAGRTLELTLQTEAVPAWQSNMVYSVLNGAYDEFLANYAQAVADFGHPVLFRLGNEMNGDWVPYAGYNTSRDPQLFVEFYRYVHSFFQQAGAQNVIWIWNPNGKSFPDFAWNDELMYYPGDEFVDVVGLTAYNTGNYYPGEHWQSFADLYEGLYYSYLYKFKQPLMITEFASSSHGGDKNQWVWEMFQHIRHYDKIKVAVWWDGADYDHGQVARDYFIDEPFSLVDLFRDQLAPIAIRN
jgi:hypothetical protein